MTKLSSPINIFGGKHYMLSKLLPLIPPHKTYVEVFGGGAKLLFAKEPSPCEVYNDIDSNLVNFFRVLREENSFQQFYHLCIHTPYSRELFEECRSTLAVEQDAVRRAWKFFVVAKMSFSGRHKSPSWSKCITQSRRGMALPVSRWIGNIEGLAKVHERFFSVLVEHQDFRDCLTKNDGEAVLFFCDPTYVHTTRQGKDRYPNELSDNDHEELINILLRLQGKVILCGYHNEIYEQLENQGWLRHDFATTSRAAARTDATGLKGKGVITEKQGRVESVWLSPNCCGGNP